MFKVDVDSLEDYFVFDPVRRPQLEQLDAAIHAAAPKLTRYFHPGTPAGQPGMRFKMIGYGAFHFAAPSGQTVEWPAIGVALQKNYISVYIPLRRNGTSVIDAHADALGALRIGDGNFSFDRSDRLDPDTLAELIADTQDLFDNDPNSLPNRVG